MDVKPRLVIRNTRGEILVADLALARIAELLDPAIHRTRPGIVGGSGKHGVVAVLLEQLVVDQVADPDVVRLVSAEAVEVERLADLRQRIARRARAHLGRACRRVVLVAGEIFRNERLAVLAELLAATLLLNKAIETRRKGRCIRCRARSGWRRFLDLLHQRRHSRIAHAHLLLAQALQHRIHVQPRRIGADNLCSRAAHDVV